MSGFKFAIDRGGTFTDVYCRDPNGKVRLMKLLSEDPNHYSDAPLHAIRQLMEEVIGKEKLDPKSSIDSNLVDSIRMGTTVATNALLERKGERCSLAITKGFKDLLLIGNQSRPDIFDLRIQMPDVLYDDVVEIDERVVLGNYDCKCYEDTPTDQAITGDLVKIVQSLDVDSTRQMLMKVYQTGCRSLAILLLHSYLYPKHEQTVASIARQIGFTNVSLSSTVMPMIKAVPRGLTVVADAYLTPAIRSYVSSFCSGFTSHAASKGTDCHVTPNPEASTNKKIYFMQSDGGLTLANNFIDSRAILSGPAGGVIGYASACFDVTKRQPVIGFDMGGTSTDVSRYGGELEHIFETTIAGVAIQAPQLNIQTVAAGGGSKLSFYGGLYKVGPESTGAFPGPVAYGNLGGELALTDANLILGRLLPELFPKIFGPNRNEALNRDLAVDKFKQLANQINDYCKLNEPNSQTLTVEQVALGFVRIANETMCRPIRSLTQAKGFDTSDHVLACFGGAGGQHACSIARLLGIKTVHVHKYAGILSAYGMALAEVVHEEQLPCQLVYNQVNIEAIDILIEKLKERAIEKLCRDGFERDKIRTDIFLHMRYSRTDGNMMIPPSGCPKQENQPWSKYGDFYSEFVDRYLREFGFTLTDRDVIVDDVRIRARVAGEEMASDLIAKADGRPPVEYKLVDTYFDEGSVKTKCFRIEDLLAGHEIDGPAIIVSSHSTILVEPRCVARVTESGNVIIEIRSPTGHRKVGQQVDAIQLSIFSHRFMSIAEQMGRIIQLTAISTNIKERLDFSCALFDANGCLVANAPHIPVHLGAMQHAVQYQIEHVDRFQPGDVLLSNHPCAGGSHLPDLTVITPVFIQDVGCSDASCKPVFFLANRGHHADIGGSTPGSMPPHSTSIHEEGAVFINFYLVKNGVFQEQAVIDALMEPAKYPGCSGTRNLSDNLSDLKAQIAANHKGVKLLHELIHDYSLPVVQSYMQYIQDNAEQAVRQLLKTTCLTARGNDESHEHLPVELSACDRLDDGSPIQLKVAIDRASGSALFDFTGTGSQVWGNTNAPRAVLLSAVIYTLRCLIGGDICLNHGCLKPIKIVVPDGTLLSPSLDAAVVGGNVLTSQRLVDVILAAFSACAPSHGCMNNVTFGSDKLGYYETVGGGAGAGPGWNGRSGVHCHMTNTRITDPEILEQRYPVVLEQFSLRPRSGGHGKWRGGDGLVRRYKFRSKMTLTVLTERRSIAPRGLCGGEPGQRGLNLLLRSNAPHPINLGGKSSVNLEPGDTFILHTPGGGGFGSVD